MHEQGLSDLMAPLIWPLVCMEAIGFGEIFNLYPDDNEANDRGFSVGHVNSDVNVCSSLYQYFDATGEVCCSTYVSMPENANAVFGLVLQNLSGVIEWYCMAGAEVAALEHLWSWEERIDLSKQFVRWGN